MKHFSLYYSLKALAFFSAGCSTGFTSVNHPVRLQILPPHCFKNRMRLRHCCGKYALLLTLSAAVVPVSSVVAVVPVAPQADAAVVPHRPAQVVLPEYTSVDTDHTLGYRVLHLSADYRYQRADSHVISTQPAPEIFR